MQRRTFKDALSSQPHHDRESTREDDVLTRVEVRETRGDFDAGFLVGGEGFVVHGNLVGFVVEVL